MYKISCFAFCLHVNETFIIPKHYRCVFRKSFKLPRNYVLHPYFWAVTRWTYWVHPSHFSPKYRYKSQPSFDKKHSADHTALTHRLTVNRKIRQITKTICLEFLCKEYWKPFIVVARILLKNVQNRTTLSGRLKWTLVCEIRQRG